jgi:hypothetical protein
MHLAESESRFCARATTEAGCLNILHVPSIFNPRG